MDNLHLNILWIDDEHENLKGTKGNAKKNGINLIPFKSLNGGISELQRNYPIYDGVLLDAKFFETEDDLAGTEDTYNIFRAKEQLLQLNKKFEIFVFTGQAEAFDDKTFNKAFANVYKKGSSVERDRLFKDIKKAAEKQEDYQIRYAFKRVFEICTEHYIGELAAQDLLDLLKVGDDLAVDNQFNTIRKIVEDLFLAFNKFNLLPKEFVSRGVSLNESSKFLTGKDSKGNHFIEKEYKHLEETHLPKIIASFIFNILSATQNGSHRSSYDAHVKTMKTPYVFKSLLYQLMEVLVWFKIYVDSKPITENWININDETLNSESSIDVISGSVINLNIQKGFAFFKPDEGSGNTFIPPHLVESNGLKELDNITVEIEEYYDQRDNQDKKRVKRIQII